MNTCIGCRKPLGNGDSVRFREVDGLSVTICSKDDKRIYAFLKNLTEKEPFKDLNQNAHYIQYPGTTFMLTEKQYHQFEGLLLSLEESSKK